MNRKIFSIIMVFVMLAVFTTPALADKPTGFDAQGKATGQTGENGFDQFGYNDTARIFSGLADGVDRILDHMVWGIPTYANDLLVMKWNEQWDICNAKGNIDPVLYCAGAWENNEWNGMVPGGSGEIWHYKIVWVGDYVATPSLIPAGGYGIWGQYVVLMDQGIDPGTGIGHLWVAHANPTGYGSYP